MRALRYGLQNLDEVPPLERDLMAQLQKVVADSYQPKAQKRACYCPRNPNKKLLGDPKVRKLTPEEKIKLQNHPMTNVV
jgi:hypothetical protein